MPPSVSARLLARLPTARDAVRVLRRDLTFIWALRRLPWPVAIFQLRAWRLGATLGDEFGRVSATRPTRLATILKLAGDGRFVVELGTAQGWTAISLALAHPGREVLSYDPFQRPEPQHYLELVPEHVRRRVTLVLERGDGGPSTDRPVDVLFVDTTHEQADTIREVEAWRPVLRDGAWLVLDDYGHPDFPGVQAAVSEMRLDGEERGGLFIHRVTHPVR
jgi:Methyltransferase domain